jgi:hypothetical protein
MTDPRETPRTELLRELVRELNELEEMLTAAVDVALQRGKQLDAVRHYADTASYPLLALRRILDGADGG